VTSLEGRHGGGGIGAAAADWRWHWGGLDSSYNPALATSHITSGGTANTRRAEEPRGGEESGGVGWQGALCGCAGGDSSTPQCSTELHCRDGQGTEAHRHVERIDADNIFVIPVEGDG
jgi:hypothetical protein